MNDVLPGDAHYWDLFDAAVRELMQQYGYRPVRTPVVERTDLFVRSIGESTDIVEKEMYSFTDSLSGEHLTLRPEATASCARAVAEHNLLYNGPQRLWYSGPMFRHERPQKGRYRQFHQVGAEAFGFAGPDIDAEQIILCARLWRRLGLRDLVLQLNSLGSLEARQGYQRRLVEYFELRLDALDEDSRRRLGRNPLRILDSKNPAMQPLIEGAPRLEEHLDAASLEHFAELKRLLAENGVAFELNPRLVRGLDYYNRTVFEWVTQALGAQGAVCAGGRYDGLLSQLGEKSAPACGFAIGVERVIELLKLRADGVAAGVPDAYIVRQGKDAESFSFGIAERLRDGGLTVILHCGGGNFAAQTRKADASGARYAVIIGDEEAAAREVSVKPLRSPGAQVRVPAEQAIALIRSG